MNDAHERLRRLLFVVPYVARHPGTEVNQLANALGISAEDLLEELDLLTMVGRPPFQPDDYIDLWVENGRIYVDLDQRFLAPPRLTAAEAAALRAGAEWLRPAANEALTSALKKLERIMPSGGRDAYREMERKIDASVEAVPGLASLEEAVSRGFEVEFDYFSQDRGAVERRTVRPLELFSHRGQWYLSAHCLSRKDERLFRVDRIRNLSLTERTFERRQTATAAVPNPAAGGGQVKVRFSPAAAPYLRERFGDDARPLPGGGVEIRVSGDSKRWLTQWVLSFGGEAEVIEPAWARESVARAAASAFGLGS